MVKIVFCLRRKDGMALEEFQRYWREEHAPLVQQHAVALGILRYVQSHTRPGPEGDLLRASRGGPEAYDGVAELWSRDTVGTARSRRRPPRGWRPGPPCWRTSGASSTWPTRRSSWPRSTRSWATPAAGVHRLGADTAWDGP